MRAPQKTKITFSYFLIFSIFIVILTYIIVDSQIRPIIYKIAEYESNVIATRIISTAVYNALTDDDFTYETLVKVSKNDIGNVSSIESNMAVINRLQATITYNINNDFKNISKENITVSSGTLSGINFLYGRGPDITFKFA